MLDLPLLLVSAQLRERTRPSNLVLHPTVSLCPTHCSLLGRSPTSSAFMSGQCIPAHAEGAQQAPRHVSSAAGALMNSLLPVLALHCMPGNVRVALEKVGCLCCVPGCTVPACCCPCLQIWPALQQADACPDGICWLWPSITARSYQTAEILASTPLLNTGYRRIVPEYSFVSAA